MGNEIILNDILQKLVEKMRNGKPMDDGKKIRFAMEKAYELGYESGFSKGAETIAKK